MFNSIYSTQLSQYYELRCSVLSKSARMHELCYLRRWDKFAAEYLDSQGYIDEDFIDRWITTLTGKSSSIENEVIVIRQFLYYLKSSGERVYLPIIPKVHDDYIPYIFSDAELRRIFDSADNIIQKDGKADPYVSIEFPVIIRLLYSCGLRIGETIKICISDVDFENGILKLINTKGDKQRFVPMSSIMTDILIKYCMTMGINNDIDQWLFPSSKSNSHIAYSTVTYWFNKILLQNGISVVNRKKHERGPCLHCMRHVFAFKSFAKAEIAGRPLNDAIPYLSIYLGHNSLDETSKYLKFSNELFPKSIDVFGDFMSGLLPEVDNET